ncbi:MULTISPECIES: hypothetical protein [Nostoc]|uniref:Uncharacterized protein n=2 Tax=Nostoc TaxID=1177 RepID=A0ABR8I555_9NOSO|nr:MULTISPECIES: hypothetical protein [Nostoc]MBD2560010.1 hypothetical protein [Nostoc linckia FACHB-391]MBD2645670.1 hypothetical protein [Nostoc foliaceum FACHB-393]
MNRDLIKCSFAIAIYPKRNIFFAHRLVKVVLQHNDSGDRYFIKTLLA